MYTVVTLQHWLKKNLTKLSKTTKLHEKSMLCYSTQIRKEWMTAFLCYAFLPKILISIRKLQLFSSDWLVLIQTYKKNLDEGGIHFVQPFMRYCLNCMILLSGMSSKIFIARRVN